MVTHVSKHLNFVLPMDLDDDVAQIIISVAFSMRTTPSPDLMLMLHVIKEPFSDVILLMEYASRFAVRRAKIAQDDGCQRLYGCASGCAAGVASHGAGRNDGRRCVKTRTNASLNPFRPPHTLQALHGSMATAKYD